MLAVAQAGVVGLGAAEGVVGGEDTVVGAGCHAERSVVGAVRYPMQRYVPGKAACLATSETEAAESAPARKTVARVKRMLAIYTGVKTERHGSCGEGRRELATGVQKRGK